MKINILYEEKMKNGHKKYTTIEIQRIVIELRLGHLLQMMRAMKKLTVSIMLLITQMKKREITSLSMKRSVRKFVRC